MTQREIALQLRRIIKWIPHKNTDIYGGMRLSAQELKEIFTTGTCKPDCARCAISTAIEQLDPAGETIQDAEVPV